MCEIIVELSKGKLLAAAFAFLRCQAMMLCSLTLSLCLMQVERMQSATMIKRYSTLDRAIK